MGVGSRPGEVTARIGGDIGCRLPADSRCIIDIAPGIIWGGGSWRLSERAKMMGVFIGMFPLPM